MAGLRLVLLLGVSLAHNGLIVEGGFLKAALGLRIGISPEEKGWGQPYVHHGGPAVKGQFLTGVQGKPGGGHGGHGGGGWGGNNGGFLKHLKILGVNLYLGGPKHHHAGGHHGGGHFGGHGGGGTHYSKGGSGGWGGWVKGYSSHPQYSPKPGGNNGAIDYSTNEVTVIGGDKGQTSHYGYATSLVGKVFGGPSPNHPFGPNPQGKPTQQHIVYVPAASQYPTHYANEVVNEIKFLNGKGNSPVMTMGNEGPRPPTINGGQISFSPAQQGSHYNGVRGSGGPPPQGFSLASLMKGPQWAPKQQPRGMARFLPFFGLRGSGGPPPPPGHPMHSPYRRPGPPQRTPPQQHSPNPNEPGNIPSYSTLYNVKTANSQQIVAQGTGFHPQQQNHNQQHNNGFNGDYRPHAFGGFVESSNPAGPGGPGGIPFVPRHVQHSNSHPSSPTYLVNNHPRSHFNAQNAPQRNPQGFNQGPPPPQRGQQGPPPGFGAGGPPGGGAPENGPETIVHSFPPQHSHSSGGPGGPGGNNGPIGYHQNSLESFNPPAFSPIPSSGEQGQGPPGHGPPGSSSGSSLIQFGNPEHSSSSPSFGYQNIFHGQQIENSPPPGSGFISLASGPAGGSSPNYPYISPLGPFASEKQRQLYATQFASGSGSSQNTVEFSPNGPPGQGGHQAQVYNEQTMGGYEPLPGFAYSHTISSPVVSMGMTTKDDPPVMMEDNSIPPEFKKVERGSSSSPSSSGESSSPVQVKRRFATSQEQQQEIYMQKRLQGSGSSASASASTTQIQSPVTGRKVRGGFLNSNIASLAAANNEQGTWSPIGQSSKVSGKKSERPSGNKKIQSRSSSAESGDMATSPTEMNAVTSLTKVVVGGGSSAEVQKSSHNSKIQFTRKRTTSTTTTTSTEVPSTTTNSTSASTSTTSN